MAKYIELAGVPGIGKTTTFNYLKAKFGKQLEFSNSNDNGLTTGGINFLKIKVKGKIARLLDPKTESDFGIDHLQNFVDNNRKINDRLWNVLAFQENSKKQDLRFVSARYTAKIFAKIHEITYSKSGKIFVVDEGLIHCINNFIYEVSKKPTSNRFLIYLI